MEQSRLKGLFAQVWAFRDRMNETAFKIPDVADALLFAYTEAGECADLFLDEKREYVRSRTKNGTVESELAQCAFMLITALGRDYKCDDRHVLASENPTVMEICGLVGVSLYEYNLAQIIHHDHSVWTIWAEKALKTIITYPTMGQYTSSHLKAVFTKICLKLDNAIELDDALKIVNDARRFA